MQSCGLSAISAGYEERKVELLGEFVFIVGDSGAGKSTLLKLLTREIAPTSGRVFVNGYNLAKIKNKKIPYFRRSIGMIFQDFRLIPDLNVYDNVAFVLRVTNKSKKTIRHRVPYVLNLVKLADRAKSYPEKLSGGEKQRVAICRALINNPDLILADEPTGNLDSKSGKIVIDALNKISSEYKKTIVMVTHDPQMASYCSRLILLKDGVILEDLKNSGNQDAFYQEILGKMKEL